MMIVIATGFIPISPLYIVSTKIMCESSRWLGKNIVRITGYLKDLQESIDRCTGLRHITETLKHHPIILPHLLYVRI